MGTVVGFARRGGRAYIAKLVRDGVDVHEHQRELGRRGGLASGFVRRAKRDRRVVEQMRPRLAAVLYCPRDVPAIHF